MREVPTFLRPGWRPGEDWTHRIDAVPRINAKVFIRYPNGTVVSALVCPATPEELKRFGGIGGDVVYVLPFLRQRVLTNRITHWKYHAIQF